MYLIDTNVISEARKGAKANAGVLAFFKQASKSATALYLSVITIGELRRGIELIRHRGDVPQAELLERWLGQVLANHRDNIIDFGAEAAEVWGRLRVPHYEHELDKQIAATALVHDLAVVTRNEAHFHATGVRLLNPFT